MSTDQNQQPNPDVDDNERTEDVTQATDGEQQQQQGQSTLSDKSSEELVSIIENLRKENASRRVKSKEQEEQAAKWREYEESQKTEMQKQQEQLQRLQQERDSLEANYNAAMLCNSYGIDASNADLLGTGSMEEMEERAKRLAELARPTGGVPSQRPVDMRTGGGQPTTVEDSTAYPAHWAPKKK